MLVEKRTQIEEVVSTSSQAHDSSVNIITDAYDFVQKAKYWLKNGSIQERRLIVTTVSSNPHLIEGNILLDLREEYNSLQKGKEVCEQTIQMFEPDKKIDGTVEYGDWMLKNPTMGGRPGSNRRHPAPQAGALPLNYGHHVKTVLYLIVTKNLTIRFVFMYFFGD